jgi:hypothetical protein
MLKPRLATALTLGLGHFLHCHSSRHLSLAVGRCKSCRRRYATQKASRVATLASRTTYVGPAFLTVCARVDYTN